MANGTAQITFVAPAVNDTYSTTQGTGISFDVETNDRLPINGNVAPWLSLSAFTTPANGTLTHMSNGQFQYVPNPGFVGTDSFTYTLNTGLNCSNVSIVTAFMPAFAADLNPSVPSPRDMVQDFNGNPAVGLVTIQVAAPAVSAPANGVVGLGLLASLLTLLGLRARRET